MIGAKVSNKKHPVRIIDAQIVKTGGAARKGNHGYLAEPQAPFILAGLDIQF